MISNKSLATAGMADRCLAKAEISVKVGIRYPCLRPVNTGIILETREYGTSRSLIVNVNDVIIIFYFQDACNSSGYQHGPLTRVSKMTPVFTRHVYGP